MPKKELRENLINVLLYRKRFEYFISIDSRKPNYNINICKSINLTNSSGIETHKLIKKFGLIKTEREGRKLKIELTNKGELVQQSLKTIKKLLENDTNL